MNRDSGHTSWCAGGHACGLGEHRSAPLVIGLGQRGRIVVTRVLGAGGERLEVRHSLRLDPGSPGVDAARLLERLARLATLPT